MPSLLTRKNCLLKLLGIIGLIGCLLLLAPLSAAPKSQLTGATLSGSEKNLQISLVLNAPVKYKVFTLKSPDRVVIDLTNTHIKGNLKQGNYNRPLLQRIRYAQRDEGTLRVVLDLKKTATVKSDMAADNKGNHILKLSLTPVKSAGGRSQTDTSRNTNTNRTPPARITNAVARNRNNSRDKNFVVVLDPGHGGRDPGAIGKRGTQEKKVVLQVAKQLKARIDATPGMRAVLTRDRDVFVPLRKRIDIAHNKNADLFISIHADANPSSRVRGSSVYILSENGASSEAARLLAKSENSAELRLGGMSFTRNSQNISSVLLDLSQNNTIDRSLEMAKKTLNELARVSNPLRRHVESAGFVVLKAPDIPSVLVEVAFISNPTEENRLRTSSYQKKLANAIYKGVKRYYRAHGNTQGRTIRTAGSLPTNRTLPSAQNSRNLTRTSTPKNYIVKSGDSLSVIADRHGVSVKALKRLNNLNSAHIKIGQKLRIPENT